MRFATGISKLLADGYNVFLECGPGQVLTTLAAQCFGEEDNAVAINTLPHPNSDTAADVSAMSAWGQLWCAGMEIDWSRLHDGSRRRVSLPTYPFERKRHWIDHRTAAPTAGVTAATTAAGAPVATGDVESLIRTQMDIMARQIAILQNRRG